MGDDWLFASALQRGSRGTLQIAVSGNDRAKSRGSARSRAEEEFEFGTEKEKMSVGQVCCREKKRRRGGIIRQKMSAYGQPMEVGVCLSQGRDS